jgi:hypothetical protein
MFIFVQSSVLKKTKGEAGEAESLFRFTPLSLPEFGFLAELI